jgi:hypothetical protein
MTRPQSTPPRILASALSELKRWVILAPIAPVLTLQITLDRVLVHLGV